MKDSKQTETAPAENWHNGTLNKVEEERERLIAVHIMGWTLYPTNLDNVRQAMEAYRNFKSESEPKQEAKEQKDERYQTAYWAGQLIGNDQAWEIAQEIIDFATKPENNSSSLIKAIKTAKSTSPDVSELVEALSKIRDINGFETIDGAQIIAKEALTRFESVNQNK